MIVSARVTLSLHRHRRNRSTVAEVEVAEEAEGVANLPLQMRLVLHAAKEFAFPLMQRGHRGLNTA